MSKRDLTIYVDEVMSSAYAHQVKVELSGAKINEVMEHFTVKEVIEYFGAEDVLAEIEKEEVLKYFGIDLI